MRGYKRVKTKLTASGSTKRWVLLILLITICIKPRIALCQESLYKVHGEYNSDNFGYVVAVLGDVNSDGIDDYAVGAPTGPVINNSPVAQGRVTVFSGLQSVKLYSILGSNQYDYFGSSIARMGDVNGDLIPDFLVGARGKQASCPSGSGGTQGYASIRSGADGAAIRTVYGSGLFGSSVAAIGDINSDGINDFVVGAHKSICSSGNSCNLCKGSISIFSGATGSLIRTHIGNAFGAEFGIVVAGIGDINGDGITDYGASSNPGNQKQTTIYSGFNGGALFTWSKGTFYGPNTALAGVGDVNADGRADIALGQVGNLSKVEIISGLTGAVLSTSTGQLLDDAYGYTISKGSDRNGDGIAEVFVGAPSYSSTVPAFVRIISGANSSTIHSYIQDTFNGGFGFSIDGTGDFTGDGKRDVLFGVPGESTRAYYLNGTVRISSATGPPNEQVWFSPINFRLYLNQ